MVDGGYGFLFFFFFSILQHRKKERRRSLNKQLAYLFILFYFFEKTKGGIELDLETLGLVGKKGVIEVRDAHFVLGISSEDERRERGFHSSLFDIII